MRVKHTWLAPAMALLLTGLLAGCGGDGNPPQGQATPVATSAPAADSGSDAYPAPATSAYPGPSADSPTADPAYPAPRQPATGRDPEPIPQPSAGMGVVHGTLYGANSDAPIYDSVTVYLSAMIQTDNTDMNAVSLDIENDPSVTPDNQGGFAFADVPPGRYGIVVQAPLNQYLAREASDQSKDVVFTVEAGQTVDLGTIYSGYP